MAENSSTVPLPPSPKEIPPLIAEEVLQEVREVDTVAQLATEAEEIATEIERMIYENGLDSECMEIQAAARTAAGAARAASNAFAEDPKEMGLLVMAALDEVRAHYQNVVEKLSPVIEEEEEKAEAEAEAETEAEANRLLKFAITEVNNKIRVDTSFTCDVFLLAVIPFVYGVWLLVRCS